MMKWIHTNMHAYMQTIFSLTCTGDVWPDKTMPMLFPESNCEYISSYRSIVPRVCLAKVPFLVFIWPDTDTIRGVALLTSPGDTDSIYPWICGYSYLGLSVFRTTIFGIPTHQEEEVWPGGTHPMLLPESSCVCAYQILGL